MGEFVGADGEIYELGKITPGKHRCKPGNDVSSWRNARYTYNMNNRGEEGGERSVNVAASNQNFRSGCIRCGPDGRNWRSCHLPFQKTLEFPPRNGPPPTGSEKALISHGSNDAESIPRVEKACQQKEMDDTNGGGEA